MRHAQPAEADKRPTAGSSRRRTESRATRAKRARYSSRAFWLTILCVAIIASCALLRDTSGVGNNAFGNTRAVRRNVVETFKKHKEEPDEDPSQDCHLVHDAKDKCAYVRTQCPDEEAGLISYLELYYCGMPKAKPVAFVIIVLWLGLLFSTIGIAASDFFCVNLSTIATLLGMSESLAGVTFLAFGNGSPDVFSTFAAMSTNSGSLAVGELIGAAGFITAVVAGSMALVRPFKVAKKSFVRDVGFFIVAASFALVFLKDGELHLWECVAMVVFYVFYVFFVVAWHWWLTRRRKRRLIEAAVRSQYVTPGGDEADVEPYHDDEDGEAAGRPSPSRGPSIEDFSNLERGGIQPEPGLEDDDEEENRERWLGELNSNMRLNRPRGERRLTQTPIRPSLVGALEFRAVLHSLKKSRNIQSIPITLRRYSDDPVFTSAQQQNQMSSDADPGVGRPPYEIVEDPSHLHVAPRQPPGQNRNRAVSVNDIDGMSVDPNVLRSDAVPQIDVFGTTPDTSTSNTLQIPIANDSLAGPASPSISVTPPGSAQGSRASSPAAMRHRMASPDRLAPPGADLPPRSPQTPSTTSMGVAPTAPQPVNQSSREYPKLAIPRQSPTLNRGRSPTLSPFPTFIDQPHSPRPPSLLLPPPSMRADSFPQFADLLEEVQQPQKPLKWWPYAILPPPAVLFSTLFPTLYSWSDKNIWEKILGLISAPSVFLLTITLPVVESDTEDGNDGADTDVPTLSLVTPASEHRNSKRDTRDSTAASQRYRDDPSTSTNDASYFSRHPNGHANGYGTLSTESHHANLRHAQPIVTSPGHPNILQSPEQLPVTSAGSADPKNWNRWLVIVQAITAPFFIVLIFWSNATDQNPRSLIKPALGSLVVSLLMLLALLMTTTPTRPPKWRSGLCFLGFVVAIGWISTIANEVVGVLKWLGVVLNISDAILGLTIFAVGNSLGDLVADITVARLGYPVMALSACFGGPMLNILLGIGVSGSYMSIKSARKHQEKHGGELVFQPYRLEVNNTLLVSGAALLVTLVGLLVAVPLRNWKMDRVIGWGLIALWLVSTVSNVVAEVFGWE